ncbi:TMEM251 isoform 1 [Pan troglodytes]|uniref:Lysosomal enzyme trafficking factor n=4 Tax=Pan TaxID=9596 RepID=H2R978_PANTR|nr:lysosomal enzyme trafficking factor isoform X1 [Pan troglodytes]XP_003832843.1 lysosomal enzyme trafficking factor isoform X1 [Pan paniscus]PNI97588.1 TMEM251 isoform 1 [Pan troglodytes]
MLAFSEMPKPPDYSELSDSLTLAVGTGRFSGPLHRAWRMMNFRQRMGWIGVGLYLLASAAAFYYVFEISETYNRLALEHIQQHPEEPLEGTTWTHSLKAQLLSLPFWLWTVIFLVPYLQMFLFLYSCTRADPKTVGYCIIPICLAVICNRHQAFVKASNQISRLQLIDT